MGVAYIGRCDFELKAPEEWSVDALGLDHYTEEWIGRADKVDEFLASLVENSVLSDVYQKMWLIGFKSDKNPVWPTVTLEYVGFKSGVPRAPRYTASRNTQSIQTNVELPDAGPSTIAIQFYAPAGEYTWYQFSEPGDNIAHSGVVSRVGALSHIIQRVITPQAGKTSSISTADYTAAMNSVQETTIVENFNVEEPVPGKLWFCRCASINTLVAT